MFDKQRSASGQKKTISFKRRDKKTYANPYFSFKMLKDLLIVVSGRFGYYTLELPFFCHLESGESGTDGSSVRQEEIDRISRKLATLEMKVNHKSTRSVFVSLQLSAFFLSVDFSVHPPFCPAVHQGVRPSVRTLVSECSHYL